MKKLLALLAAGSLIAGCGVAPSTSSNDSNPTFGAKRLLPKGAKKWTIMVHLAADNNLYNFGLEDLNEMEAGINPDDVNVIVLFDGEPAGDSGVYEIKKDPGGKNGTIISPLNQNLPFIPANHEINSGDPKVMQQFLEWAIAKYPAAHYGIDVWDHGSGIFRGGMYNEAPFITKGFGWDDNGGHMNTADLSNLVPAAAKAAGQPIDFFGFDACLMGHLEIGYQMKGYCNYLVASEETEPGAGWDYLNWLKTVNGNSSAADVASNLVDSYGKSYVPGGSQNPGTRVMDCTLAASDINAMTGKLVPAMNAFSTAMTAALPTDKAALSSARSQTQSFYNSDCADIGHFAKLVSAANVSAPVKAAAKDVLSALNATVIRETHTGKSAYAGVANANGLQVYFPNAGTSYNTTYDNASAIAYAAEGWRTFLKAFVKK